MELVRSAGVDIGSKSHSGGQAVLVGGIAHFLSNVPLRELGLLQVAMRFSLKTRHVTIKLGGEFHDLAARIQTDTIFPCRPSLVLLEEYVEE